METGSRSSSTTWACNCMHFLVERHSFRTAHASVAHTAVAHSICPHLHCFHFSRSCEHCWTGIPSALRATEALLSPFICSGYSCFTRYLVDSAHQTKLLCHPDLVAPRANKRSRESNAEEAETGSSSSVTTLVLGYDTIVYRLLSVRRSRLLQQQLSQISCF